MTLKDLKQIFHNKLDLIYDEDEVASLFFITLRNILDLTRTDFVLSKNLELSSSNKKRFLDVLKDLEREKPIQYILGETEFYGLRFKVNGAVLIPRPETEELVHWICETYKDYPKELKILDVGTGSGCIAVSLAKHLPMATVFALDLSRSAIDLAKENAKSNNAEITFLEADILKASNWENTFNEDNIDSFDIIVSNPPYVKQSEKSEIKPNVLDFEPHLALFVDDNDPLQFYRAILEFAKDVLTKGGKLFFEINQNLGDGMVNLLQEFSYSSVALKNDINGNARMIKAVKTF